jgi:hypothetical protein
MELGSQELCNLHSSSNTIWVNKSRRMGWTGHVARVKGKGGDYRVLVGIPKGKRPSGTPRRRWECNTKIYLQEMGLADTNWMELAQDGNRLRGTCEEGLCPI